MKEFHNNLIFTTNLSKKQGWMSWALRFHIWLLNHLSPIVGASLWRIVWSKWVTFSSRNETSTRIANTFLPDCHKKDSRDGKWSEQKSC